MIRRGFIAALFSLASFHSNAQNDDLLSLLDVIDSGKVEKEYVYASFKTTRIINSHSIENTAAGVLDFRISHRFGSVQNGFYDLFGLDQATIRLGLDYGVSDRLMIGLGRSTFEKTYDGFFKYKLLRQTKPGGGMPVSVSAFAGMYYNTLKWSDPSRTNFWYHRLSYAYQLLLARKFSESFTLQLMPSIVHRNLVETRKESNTVFAMGAGIRQKLNKRISLNLEYYYVLPNQLAPGYYNSFSIGLDIETGGHVFQLHFTNSSPIIEKGFITQTTGSWADGGIHFGFNIHRVFTVVKPKEFR